MKARRIKCPKEDEALLMERKYRNYGLSLSDGTIWVWRGHKSAWAAYSSGLVHVGFNDNVR